MRCTDVAIIGGGIIGCAIAYDLVQAGIPDVVVLEKGSPAGGATGVDGLYLAVGFSGHGFIIAPAVAEMVGAVIREEENALPLSAFGLDRFATTGASEGLYI